MKDDPELEKLFEGMSREAARKVAKGSPKKKVEAKEKEDDNYDRVKSGTGLPGRNRNCKTSKSSGNNKLFIDLLKGFREIAIDIQASDEVVETIDKLIAEVTNNDTANNE